MQRIIQCVFLAALMLLTWSCQQATQPENVTVTRTMTVQVVEANGTPVVNARVDWQKRTGPASPVGGTVRTATGGYATFAVPDVSTARDLVTMRITMPLDTKYAGIDPIDWQDSICTDTTITIVVQPTIPCGTVNLADTIEIAVCPSAGTTTRTECRYYPTSCAPGLVFTAQPTAFSNVLLELTNQGTAASMLRVCATFTPPRNAPAGSEMLQTIVTGAYPGDPTVRLQIALTVIARVDCDDCACPSIQNASVNLGSVCVGTSTDTTVALSTLLRPLDLGDGCVAEFTFDRATSDDVSVSGRTFSVSGKQSFPDLGISVAPKALGQNTATLTYTVRVRNTRTGVVQDCPTPLTITLTYEAIQGSCRVTGFPLDTLEKCVFNDQVPADTFHIENTGNCAVTVTVSSPNPLFGVEPSGGVVIPAGGRVPIQVRFTASKTDWDRNPALPRGTRGDKDFAGEIVVDGCAGQPQRFPVRGIAYVQCDAFKYQCLRQFRPTGYENVYAESIELADQKTIITYQNDNQTFRVFDIYVQRIDAAGNVTLATGVDPKSGQSYGGFVRVTSGFTVLPGQNICDTYPAAASQLCSDVKTGAVSAPASLGGLRQGDVVLFVKQGSAGPQCALIWIQSVGPDRPGAVALDQVCLEICYPVFTI